MRPGTDNLPPNTPSAVGHNASAIRRFVDIQLQKPHPPAYVVFTNVPHNVVGESRDNPRLLGPKGLKICYDEEPRRLILKLTASPHEVAHRELARIIDADTAIMGLEAQLKCVGAGRVTHAHISQEPDASFKPTNLPPGRSNQWPTVVVECGDSKATAHLRCMDLWVGNSGGQVTVVIIISVDRPPRRVIFEKWIPDAAQQNRGVSAVREQEIIVTRSQNGQPVVNGGPLLIGFEETFLRPPVPPEHDYVIHPHRLGLIVRHIWDEWFEPADQ